MKCLLLLCYAHKKNKVTKLYKPQTIEMYISYTTCVHIVKIIRLFNWVYVVYTDNCTMKVCVHHIPSGPIIHLSVAHWPLPHWPTPLNKIHILFNLQESPEWNTHDVGKGFDFCCVEVAFWYKSRRLYHSSQYQFFVMMESVVNPKLFWEACCWCARADYLFML